MFAIAKCLSRIWPLASPKLHCSRRKGDLMKKRISILLLILFLLSATNALAGIDPPIIVQGGGEADPPIIIQGGNVAQQPTGTDPVTTAALQILTAIVGVL
jgi:PhoPQ-activated pathogenicity-related protein